MNSLSNHFLRVAVIAALCGMVWGVVMAATQNFAPASAHAHLNLLGWVSMALYGLFYRVVPTAAVGRLPTAHFWVALAGVIVFVPSLGVLLAGPKAYAAPAEVGAFVASVLVISSMIIFSIVVFRATTSKA